MDTRSIALTRLSASIEPAIATCNLLRIDLGGEEPKAARCKQIHVIVVPLAAKDFLRIVEKFLFQKLPELRVAALHLIPSCPAMIGQVIGAIISDGKINQMSHDLARFPDAEVSVLGMQVQNDTCIALASPGEE